MLWAANFERVGFTGVGDPSWDRVYAAAQDLEMSINLHVGFTSMTKPVAELAATDTAEARAARSPS